LGLDTRSVDAEKDEILYAGVKGSKDRPKVWLRKKEKMRFRLSNPAIKEYHGMAEDWVHRYRAKHG
jgi:hypothetical protein